MKSRTCLSVAAGLAVAFTIACSSARQASVSPTYTLDCDNPGQNDPTAVRAIASGLAYGNPFHGRAGPGPIQPGQAPFRAILVGENANGQTFIGPPSEVVSEAQAYRFSATALESGKIIAKVWVEQAFQAGPDATDISLPQGSSYIGACVPKNAVNGTAIKGLVIPETTGTITQLSGTYHTTRETMGNALAVWQSSSKSTLCIACGRGWCQF